MRLFSPRPRASAANDTQLIPLINIIFLMLIFFMVAGRISAQNTAAPITLPEAALEQAAAEHAVRLEMTREGALLLDGAALENAALVSDAETAEQTISELGLCENLCQLPRELSGGMRRRVALARALSYGGDALFLDEPFTGLDEANKEIAVRAILSSGVPVYVITHDDAEAALFGDHSTITIRPQSGENLA